MTHGVRWAWLGRVGFQPVWDLQEELRRRVQAGDAGAEAVLLCEHDPVITLGRGANPANVLLSPEALAARGVDLVPTTRGGDVTYHGPGQLVVYPVVRLRRGLLTTLELVAGVLVRIARVLGVVRPLEGSAAVRRRQLAAALRARPRGVVLPALGFQPDAALPSSGRTTPRTRAACPSVTSSTLPRAYSSAGSPSTAVRNSR